MYQIEDLAREVFCPNFFQTKDRSDYLIDYLNSQQLGDRYTNWVMGMWLYPNGAEQMIRYLLSEIHTILPVSYESSGRSSITTFERMMLVLNWQSRSISFKGELVTLLSGF